MTVIPEHIIKEALQKGGYEPTNGEVPAAGPWDVNSVRLWFSGDFSNMILSPAFWQALGKARGWEQRMESWNIRGRNMGHWLYELHRFIDVLAISPSQEQIDRFWSELP